MEHRHDEPNQDKGMLNALSLVNAPLHLLSLLIVSFHLIFLTFHETQAEVCYKSLTGSFPFFQHTYCQDLNGIGCISKVSIRMSFHLERRKRVKQYFFAVLQFQQDVISPLVSSQATIINHLKIVPLTNQVFHPGLRPLLPP